MLTLRPTCGIESKIEVTLVSIWIGDTKIILKRLTHIMPKTMIWNENSRALALRFDDV